MNKNLRPNRSTIPAEITLDTRLTDPSTMAEIKAPSRPKPTEWKRLGE